MNRTESIIYLFGFLVPEGASIKGSEFAKRVSRVCNGDPANENGVANYIKSNMLNVSKINNKIIINPVGSAEIPADLPQKQF